jgi:hypothetical protein
MRPRQFVAIGAVGGAVALAAWGAATLGGFGSSGMRNAATPPRGAISSSADAKSVDTPPARAATQPAPDAAMSHPGPREPVADVPAGAPSRPAVEPAAASAKDATAVAGPPEPAVAPAGDSTAAAPRVQTASADPAVTLPPATPLKTGVALASLFRPDSAKEIPKPVVRPLDTVDECLVPEPCIDDYLWALYERAPKIDTNKVIEHISVTVKKKGKKGKTLTVKVKKAITKYVVGDFTWKDPIAAQKAGMSLKDYVIGGMDRSFKLKLFRAARQMEDAGLMPGITSAFRDDYRQSIAVGNTAASDSSYHGGSRRGGYGHGLAVDIVSVKGETRMQRYAASDELWKWIDAREKELGVGRPYLDRDPPHIGPLDGKEYAAKRAVAKVKIAALAKKKARAAKAADAKKRMAKRNDTSAAKRAKPAKSARTATLKDR